MTRLRLVLALLVAATLAIAGCGGSSDDQPGSLTTTTGSPITVDRTGGNAPVDDHVVLQPDGTWTATDKSGATKAGKLNAQQTAAAYAIVNSTAFAAEAARPPATARCIDAPTVTISYGSQKVVFLDCGTPDAPAQAGALLRTIQEQILS
jgi:hypothetical protein